MKILAVATNLIFLVGAAFASTNETANTAMTGMTDEGSWHRELNIYSTFRWKDRSTTNPGRAIIPFSVSGIFSSSEKSKIRSALDDLEGRTGALRFIDNSSQGHYIKVVRLSNRCHSKVGKIGGAQILNLGSGCMSKGIIQHEFMHALGFHHEHTRPDRDQYITILWDNIEDRRWRHNFIRSDGSQTLGSPYDFGSVMHYRETAFGSGGRKTIVPKNGNRISRSDSVSDNDVKKLKLLYQCENGVVRDWDSLINSPCTSDCKCPKGELGCGSNDNACHGSLVCSNNRCQEPGSTQTHCGCNTCTQTVWDSIATMGDVSATCGARISWVQSTWGYSEDDACSLVTSEFPDICPCDPSCSAPPPAPSAEPFLIWQSYPRGESDDFRCMDLRYGDPANGNYVWYYPCNFTPAQYWYRDYNTNYIRSSIDRNKCLVGASGSSETGTRLIINDCHHDDDRFRWDIYTDESIRPRNNKWACVEVDINAGSGSGLYLILDHCHDGYKTLKWQQKGSSGRRRLGGSMLGATSAKSPSNVERHNSGIFESRSADDCEDSPVGWYDIFGRNCAWYGGEELYCAIYGDQYNNFGKTAQTACCVCGGGASSSGPALDRIGVMEAAKYTVEAEQSCWDQPNFYDSTGDGCIWYEEGNNCEYFGSQFPSSIDGKTANEACCTCGGGLSEPPPLDEDVENDMPGCSDSPFDWFDDVGLGCDWYALEDMNCFEFGDVVGADGITPNEACCACGGGFDPNN